VGTGVSGANVGLVLPKSVQPTAATSGPGSKKSAKKSGAKFEGLMVRKTSKKLVKSLKEQLPDLSQKLDSTRLYELDQQTKAGGRITQVKLPKEGLRTAVLLTAPDKEDALAKFTVMQEENDNIVGGSTYVISTSKK
jgi:hypothetical protein